MEFRLLGPIEMWSDGQRHDAGWAKERHVLAVLALTPGQPVTVESLVTRVWDDDPPDRARDHLYSRISRLRATLNSMGEDAFIRNGRRAYVLETDKKNVDVHQFRELRSSARAVADSDPDHAVRMLRQAAALWRGEPLAGLTGAWVLGVRQGLESELSDSVLERCELELRLGRHAELVPELYELSKRDPLLEKPVELLMTALAGSGRVTEALSVYRLTRLRLREELGMDPGEALRALHQRLLRGDPSLLPTARAATPGGPAANLPRDQSTFTGRESELARLTELAIPHPTAVTVLAVDGMPGIGKTALVVHLAHLLAPHYPDGRLFLNLRGHSGEYDPLDPAEALSRLLGMIGVSRTEIPAGLEDRAALWRGRLASRRILLVLDDARGHEQVGDLLPGAPGSLVLVTSRRRLAGLDDAHCLSLEPLPPDEAARLFGRLIGPIRAEERDQVATVVGLCGHLPLAIQLAGNRLRHLPAWSVSDLASRLADDRRRLTEIRADNREITAAFDLSFRELGEASRRAFWSLGLHPGPDITLEAASAALDDEGLGVERLLDELYAHHLLAEPQRGRYRFHDLIRDYARAWSEAQPESERRGVFSRLLDYYLFCADQADRMLPPSRPRPPLRAVPVPGLQPPLDDPREWLDAELDNLLALMRQTSDGWPEHTGLLARVLAHYLETGGHWEQAVAVHERAIVAWRALRDDAGAARALTDLAKVRWRAGDHDDALRRAGEALAIQTRLGDFQGVGDLLDQIGLIHWHRSDFAAAREHYERALDIRRTLGDRPAEAESLGHLAIIAWHMSDYGTAARQLREALAVYREIGDDYHQAMTLNNLAEIEMRLGRHAAALDYYEQVTAVGLTMGRQHQAIWLSNVAVARQHLGRNPEALDYFQQSWAIYREIGDKRGESDVLNNIGFFHGQQGNDGEALVHHQRALTVARGINERYEESIALRGIGDVHQRAARHGDALEHYQVALDLAKAIGDGYQKALTLERMGASIKETGDMSEGQDCLEQALALYEQLGVPEAESLRTRLAAGPRSEARRAV
ncbi:tetratricopeptide repeat protein [Streptosporangiaceae bacterium NEAU-GS5]|nr:tetratricopeptide repeat protein [Streptosporangiaceae bacterium NEAU-GS5]